jgi:hypothetical protein
MNLPNPFPGNNPIVSVQTTVTIKNKSSKIASAGQNGCLAVLILDESLSMLGFTKQTIDGANHFVREQASDPIKTNVMVVKFTSGNVQTIIDNVDAKEAPAITNHTYRPSGSTNLLDAIGVTIKQVDAYLHGLPKKLRPSVILQITTDGEENSSREYNYQQIKDMISLAQRKNWLFSFVGANIDSFQVSQSLGINAGAVSNYTLNNSAQAFATMGIALRSAKVGLTSGVSGQSIASDYYSEDDRTTMNGGK